MDWKKARDKLQGGDSFALRRYIQRENPYLSEVNDRVIGDYLAGLIDEREVLNTIETWHARLAEATGDEGIERLVRIVEAVTGISDDEIFPSAAGQRRLRQAEALRQRRPDPVPVDPMLQGSMDLPMSPQAIVQAHMLAWLHDFRGKTLPSPVARYVRARQWGEGRYAARVRLFDGSPATIYVEGEPKPSVMPNIRHDGTSIYFHGGEWAWKRALPGQTFEDRARELGEDFY